MHVESQQQHQWLQQLVGEWTYEFEHAAENGKDPEKLTGSERVRSLGEVWIVSEGQGTMPGGDVGRTLMTLGYDQQKGRFVGTWIGSMMSTLWVYDGALDAGERKLQLDAEGPHMEIEGKMAMYRDVVEFLGPDERTLTSYMQGDDGEWHQFMQVNYRRQA